MLRETPSLTQNPNLCPRLQGLLSGSPSRFTLQQCCVRRLSSWAGADSQRSGHSQVRSAWPGGEETVSGDRSAVKSSSFSGKQPCPLPAGVTSSARHAFPSLFPFTTAVFSSASERCQPGTEQMVELVGRWEHGKSHGQAVGRQLCKAECSAESICGNRGQEWLRWVSAASMIRRR